MRNRWWATCDVCPAAPLILRGQDKLQLSRTWEFRDEWGVPARRRIAAHSAASIRHAMDNIHDAFVRAVERRAGGDVQVGMSLSGGYDSRTLLAAVDRKRHRVKTLTLDMAGGADQQIAERIARHATACAAPVRRD